MTKRDRDALYPRAESDSIADFVNPFEGSYECFLDHVVGVDHATEQPSDGVRHSANMTTIQRFLRPTIAVARAFYEFAVRMK